MPGGVVFPDGHTEVLRIAAGQIPSPEFDSGQPLMADLYNGVVERVQGLYQTLLPTFANPTGQIERFHEYALIVPATGVGLLVLGWLTGAWPCPREPA